MFKIIEDSANETIATLYFEAPEEPFDLTLLVRNDTLSSFYQFLENLAYKEPDNLEIQLLKRSIAIEQHITMEDVIYMGSGKTLMFNQRLERQYLRKRLQTIKKLFGKDSNEYRETYEYYRQRYSF